MVYLITFCCYGSHLPGQENIVSRHNNLVGSRLPLPDSALARAAGATMIHASTQLNSYEREIVLQTITEVCRHREWTLLAAHVRTTHVHVVIAAEVLPERIMNALKSYSSRALNCRRRWARHGSTVYLWSSEAVSNAVHYVVSKQGEPMALYAQPNPDRQGGDLRTLTDNPETKE